MPESTFALSRADLQSYLGDWLGYGLGLAQGDVAWDTYQTAAINRDLKCGLAWFYWPEPLPGEKSSYEWSFLKPEFTFSVASGDREFELPDDFGWIDGSLYLVDSGRFAQALEQVGLARIDLAFSQQENATGTPLYFCILPHKETTGNAGTRHLIRFFPEPNGSFNLSMRYSVVPDNLTDSFPYALGGAQHADTIRAACLAAAELDEDKAKGAQWELFVGQLRKSVSLDRKLLPAKMGYNGDPGMNQLYDGRLTRRDLGWVNPITYNGSDID